MRYKMRKLAKIMAGVRTYRTTLIYTDGSLVKGIAGSGIWTTNGWTKKFRTRGVQTIWNAEAQAAAKAVEWAYKQENQAIIVIDNRGVADALGKWWCAHTKWVRIAAGSYLERAAKIIHNSCGKIKVIWYPSHAEKKLSMEEKRDMVIKARNEWPNSWKVLEVGNEMADRVASDGRQENVPKDTRKVWGLGKGISLWDEDENEPLDGTWTKKMRKVWQLERKKKLKGQVTMEAWDKDNISWQHSVRLSGMMSREDMSIWAFAMKARLGSLEVNNKCKHYLQQEKCKLKYKDGKCEYCREEEKEDVEETWKHMLFECPRHKIARKAVDLAVHATLGKLLRKAGNRGKYTEWKYKSWISGKIYAYKIKTPPGTRAKVLETLDTGLGRGAAWGGCTPKPIVAALTNLGVAQAKMATALTKAAKEIAREGRRMYKASRKYKAELQKTGK